MMQHLSFVALFFSLMFPLATAGQEVRIETYVPSEATRINQAPSDADEGEKCSAAVLSGTEQLHFGANCAIHSPYTADVGIWKRNRAHFSEWVLSGKVFESIKVIDFIMDSVNKDPYRCTDETCEAIVKGFSDTTPGAQIYLNCSEPTKQKGFGAPSCEPVLLIENKKIWILVTTSLQGGSPGAPASGALGFPLAILGDLPAMNDVLAALNEALTTSQLSLTTIPTPIATSIRAGCNARISKVIAPYRERATVTVDVQQGGVGEEVYIGVWLSSTLIVNRLATDNNTDWHQPSDVQTQTFQDALISALRWKLAQICTPNHLHTGGRIIACGKNPKLPPGVW